MAIPPVRLPRRASALLAALLLASPATAQQPAAAYGAEPLGIFGTIPLYWGEADSMAEVLAGTATPHWARAALETRHTLQPLATLSAEDLARLRHLLIAQPRILSAAENVALDAWVRAGGRLLLFADPLLTAESRYPLGDPRRPQDVVLLSPLLTHWGLELRFDPDQPPTRQTREIAGILLPHHLSGQLVQARGAADCMVDAAEILADCSIGQGRAVIVADADLLDLHHPAADAGAALIALTARAFAGPANPLKDNGLAVGSDNQTVDKAVQNLP